MIEEKKALELLEFINLNHNKQVDYSSLFGDELILLEYCNHLHQLGFLVTWSMINLSEITANTREINQTRVLTNRRILMTAVIHANGRNHLIDINRTPYEKVRKYFKDNYPSVLFKGSFSLIGWVAGLITPKVWEFLMHQIR